MVEVPKLDERGRPVLANIPVMVDQIVDEQTIVQGPMASQVAIKMLAEARADDDEARRRLLNEARAAAALDGVRVPFSCARPIASISGITRSL
jgi:hypothetical protein